MGFLRVWRELPSVEDILANPADALVPDDPAALYAVCEALSEKAADAGRLPSEFGVLLMRDAVCRDERIVRTSAFADWAQANAHVLM